MPSCVPLLSHRVNVFLGRSLTLSLALWISLHTVVFAETKIVKEGADLQQLLNQAIKEKAREVKLPPGVYALSAADKGALLDLDGADNLVVDATGVRIVGSTLSTGLRLTDCSGVTIRGLTIDYDPLPFTQGVVTAVNAKDGYVEVAIDPGYPDTVDYVRCGVYDALTRKIKSDTTPAYNKSVERVKERLVRVKISEEGQRNLKVGDLFVLANGRQSPHGVVIYHCSAITLEDVTLWSAPVLGIFESGGAGGNIYRRVSITPGPPPSGAATPRLRSSVADGIHSSGTAKGPLIEDCLLEDMADDGIAIHGGYDLLLEAIPTGIILAGKEKQKLSEGETIEVVEPNGSVRGRAVIKSIRPRPDYKREARDKVVHDYLWERQRRYYQNVYEAVLDVPIAGAKAGDRVAGESHSGNGFVIRNNRISHNRARGIMIRAGDGLIEGNTIDGPTRAGIALSPDLNWNEAGYSRNVMIRKNTIRDAGREAYLMNNPESGAISICAYRKEGNTPSGRGIYAVPGGHQSIEISGNRFENCAGINILITSAESIDVKDNVFSRPNAGSIQDAGGFGADPSAVIWITQAKDVRFKDNRLVAPGPGTQRFLKTTSSATHVTGGEEMEVWKP